MLVLGLGTLATAGTSSFIALAVLLTAVIGAIQLAMGAMRLGFLVNFLSYPVLAGFTSAAAVITVLGQLKHLLGVESAAASCARTRQWPTCSSTSAQANAATVVDRGRLHRRSVGSEALGADGAWRRWLSSSCAHCSRMRRDWMLAE